jgi:hypothetical protein
VDDRVLALERGPDRVEVRHVGDDSVVAAVGVIGRAVRPIEVGEPVLLPVVEVIDDRRSALSVGSRHQHVSWHGRPESPRIVNTDRSRPVPTCYYFGADLDADGRFLEELEAAYGDEVAVKSLDAGGRFDWKEALSAYDRLSRFEFTHPESPVPGEDVDGLARVTERVDRPVSEHASSIPCALELIDRKAVDGFNVSLVRIGGIRRDDADPAAYTEDYLRNHNPVSEEALLQLTMGAPKQIYYGGLVMARVRHFDRKRDRPGLPPGVAALVEGLDDDGVRLRLVNVGSETGELAVQAGGYGEHTFTRVSSDDDREVVRPDDAAVTMTLPPNTGTTLDARLERFDNDPGYEPPI